MTYDHLSAAERLAALAAEHANRVDAEARFPAETVEAALRHTAGLNEEVFDGLVLLAAGSFEPAAVARGHAAVQDLVAQMDAGRRLRLRRLGFPASRAAELSALHTRNFM